MEVREGAGALRRQLGEHGSFLLVEANPSAVEPVHDLASAGLLICSDLFHQEIHEGTNAAREGENIRLDTQRTVGRVGLIFSLAAAQRLFFAHHGNLRRNHQRGHGTHYALFFSVRAA